MVRPNLKEFWRLCIKDHRNGDFVHTGVDMRKITSGSENCNAGIARGATGPKPEIVSLLFGAKRQGTAPGRGVEVLQGVEIVNTITESPTESPYGVSGA
jgi:hypothetical protein